MLQGDNKFIIVGKSSVGKDYIANNFMDFGKIRLTTYTTRPPRYKEDKTHYFIRTQAEYDAIPLNERMLQTNILGAEYFARKSDIADSDVLILDPKGVEEILEAFPNTGFHIIYVTADPTDRINAALIRQDVRLQAACPLLATKLNYAFSQALSGYDAFDTICKEAIEEGIRNIDRQLPLTEEDKNSLRKSIHLVCDRFRDEEQAFEKFEKTFYGWIRASRYQDASGDNIGLPENVVNLWEIRNDFQSTAIEDKVREIIRTDEMAKRWCGKQQCIVDQDTGDAPNGL